MPLYEHVFLTRQDASAQQVEELTAQFKGIIEQLGGKIAKAEQWGVKSLSYRLRKNRKAHFTMFNLDAPAAAINELERQERLNEDVLRYLSVRVDEHEEGPSAMMRKVDRDRERDERGFGFRDRDRGGFRERDRGEHRRDRDSRPPREDGEAPPAEARHNRDGTSSTAGAPAVLPSPQDLPVLGRQRAEDRLQGREAVTALRLRARQDRTEPYHCGIRQAATRARSCDQACTLSRIAAVRDQVTAGGSAQEADGELDDGPEMRGVR